MKGTSALPDLSPLGEAFAREARADTALPVTPRITESSDVVWEDANGNPVPAPALPVTEAGRALLDAYAPMPDYGTDATAEEYSWEADEISDRQRLAARILAIEAEAVTAYKESLTKTGRTIMSLARVRELTAIENAQRTIEAEAATHHHGMAVCSDCDVMVRLDRQARDGEVARLLAPYANFADDYLIPIGKVRALIEKGTE